VLKRVRHALHEAQNDGHVVQDLGPGGRLWWLAEDLTGVNLLANP